MFTGIIEEIGEVRSISNVGNARRIAIKADKIFSDMKIGCSIAVNGICLTVTNWQDNIFYADVMPETMRSSAFKSLNVGSKLNLERAMPANGRFDGHIVAGHIDGIANLVKKHQEDNSIIFTFETTKEIAKYIVYKGSVAINGISLTVSNVEGESFSVSLIPHSLTKTTMQYLKKGDIVNIETDVLGRYIEKFLSNKSTENKKESKITNEFLLSNGFI